MEKLKEKKINVFTIRKIKSINEKGEIDGRILFEDYELVGKLIKDRYTDEDGNERISERREHLFPCPGKEIVISGKKYIVHSITIPEELNKNRIINLK